MTDEMDGAGVENRENQSEAVVSVPADESAFVGPVDELRERFQNLCEQQLENYDALAYSYVGSLRKRISTAKPGVATLEETTTAFCCCIWHWIHTIASFFPKGSLGLRGDSNLGEVK